MLEALSLYSGGTLIKAENSSYEEYKEKGLVCPICYKPVFLCREFNRGESLVRPHFKHFKEDENQGKLCENRKNSKKYKEYINFISPKKRGQRLKLFERRFWEIYSYKKEVKFEKSADEYCKESFKLFVPELSIKFCLKCEDAIREAHERSFNPKKSFVKESFFTDWFDAAFSPRNRAIRAEAITFLKSNYSCFKKIVLMALADAKESGKSPGEMMHFSLTLTDWEEAIAHVSKSGIGFK